MTHVFGESTQRAHCDYYCDLCCQTIDAGELYQRFVVKIDDARVYIVRRHTNCDPDDPHDHYKAELEYEPQDFRLAA